MTTAPLLKSVSAETQRLDPAVRLDMERSLSAPFGDVVVHDGPESAELAEQQHAAAFTVGRHVVFGPGRYDPSSLRGRALIAHELAHVTEQRRGGGDQDLGEHRSVSRMPAHGSHSRGHHATAARAALGASAPVTGSATVGVARQDKDDEDTTTWLKRKARDYVKKGIGTAEGVVDVAANLVETGAWAAGKVSELKDEAIDEVGDALDFDPRVLTVVKDIDGYKAVHALADRAGLVDKETGDIALVPSVTRGADWLEKRVDQAEVFKGLPTDDGFFTTRELAQLEATIGTEAVLAAVGVEEVELVLKVLSGIGAAKAVYEAGMRSKDPQGFVHDPAFWTAVAQAVLFLLGLKATKAGNKVLALAVHIGSTSITTLNEAMKVYEAYQMPPGEERDAALKASILSLVRILADQVRQAISSQRGLPGKGRGGEIEPASKGAGQHGEGSIPGTSSAKPAPKVLGPPAPKTSNVGETEPVSKSPSHGEAPVPATPSPKPAPKVLGPPAPKTAGVPAAGSSHPEAVTTPTSAKAPKSKTPSGGKSSSGTKSKADPAKATQAKPKPASTTAKGPAKGPAKGAAKGPAKGKGSAKGSSKGSAKGAAKAPRFRPGSGPFDPKTSRRPTFAHMEAPAEIDVVGSNGLRTKPDARVSVFNEPFGKRVAPLMSGTKQEQGDDYERQAREDLLGGSKLRKSHTAGDKTRHGDVGSYETKFKRKLSTEDFDQVWRDLNNPAEGHSVLIITPKADPKDLTRLARMAATFEKLTGKRAHIAVRETAPAGSKP
jgi:hypothetical protein